MRQRGGYAGLSGAEHTTRTGRKGEKETRAEGEEERGGHEEVGLGEHETHRASDETVHEEEHQRVEKNSHLVGFAVHKLDVLARGSDENTGAERKKKGGGDGNFLRSKFREHLIYAHIIFSKVCEMIERGTS